MDQLSQIRHRRAATAVVQAGINGGEFGAVLALRDATTGANLAPVFALLVEMIMDDFRREIDDADVTTPLHILAEKQDGTTSEPEPVDSGLGMVVRALRAAQDGEPERVRELVDQLLDLPDETERSTGLMWILQVASGLGGRALARDGRLS